MLRWYGLRDVESANSPLSPVPSVPAAPGDAVVALDEAGRFPASLLAAAGGRPLVDAMADDGWPDRLEALRPASIAFVGAPTEFTAARLQQLDGAFSVPWGIFTARDLSSLTFAIAKAVAARNGDHEPSAAVDAVQGWFMLAETDESGTLRAERLPASGRAAFLTSRRWENLVLHAHGESGHAKLGSAVLCGLTGDVEKDGEGRPIGGCRADEASRCKRVHEDGVSIVRLRDVAARQICLLSCNSFAVAGELYPSDVSLVLAAAEGWPASLVACDRALPIDEEVAGLSLQLLMRGRGMGAVRNALNARHAEASAAHPYVLVGDPRRGPARSRLPRKRVTNGEARRPAAARLEPFQDLERRLVRLTRVQHAAIDLAGDVVVAAPELRARLDELQAAKVDLERTLQRAVRAVAGLGGMAVADAALESLAQLAWMHARLCDAALARALAGHVLQEELHAILADGYIPAPVERSGECDHCRGPLAARSTAEPDGGEGPVTWTCATCGPCEVHWPGEPRLVVDAPPAFRPGQSARIDVRRDGSSRGGGTVVVEIKDNGWGRVYFSRVRQDNQCSLSLVADVPADAALDMHTVRVAWVDRLTISYRRLRRPCVPAGRPARRRESA